MRIIKLLPWTILVTQAHADEFRRNHTVEVQGSAKRLMDKLVDELFDHTLQERLLHTGLNNISLGSPGHLQLAQAQARFARSYHGSILPYTRSHTGRVIRAAADTAVEGTSVNNAWKYDPKMVRNFCIVAHIDHGKSTLADRLLEYTKTVAQRDMQAQLLDSNPIERERGITIKLQAARLLYPAKDGKTYLLNLIDTPGHVDFGYEVSRSLAACEGALLVVDATQGVEAQTISNVYLAMENELEIVPVLNKIDLPSADCDRVAEEVESTIGLDCTDAIQASAKSGIGIEEILEAVVTRIPPPETEEALECDGPLVDKPLRALIFDSYYDNYRGVIVFFRVVEGSITKGDKVRFLASGKEYEVLDVGVMTPSQISVPVLRAGEVGYFTAGIKSLDDARVGDTVALAKQWDGLEMLPGYAPAKPMVYCGLYPSDSSDYEKLRDAITKLKLNDAALTFMPEVSNTMGFGFRCGFLGLLHMDIVQERLEREFDVDLIITAPSVVYMTRRTVKGEVEETMIETPSKLPDNTRFDAVLEPYVKLEMLSPTEYTGPLMDLAQNRRGVFMDMKSITATRSELIYEMPLAEVITDFFDQVKSRSKGYASMSFTEIGYRPEKLVKLTIRVNGDDAPPLASIVHKEKAHMVGKAMCNKLKELIPRQQFRVAVQACIGEKPVASSHISAIKKDVLAKCYGGDISRKKKLLQKQAKGKKRMKALGSVNVPQEAFMAVIAINQDE